MLPPLPPLTAHERAALTDRQSTVLAMLAFPRMTVEDVAAHLGTSVTAVVRIRDTALHRLRTLDQHTPVVSKSVSEMIAEIADRYQQPTDVYEAVVKGENIPEVFVVPGETITAPSFTNLNNSGILITEMPEVEPNTLHEAEPLTSAGSTVESSQNPEPSLPWSEGSTPDEIGRCALAAVQAIRQRQNQLEQELSQLRSDEQTIVLACKDAAQFSWSALASLFGKSKSYMVGRYDANTKASRKHYQKRLHQAGVKALRES